jgi:hypothetical protein
MAAVLPHYYEIMACSDGILLRGTICLSLHPLEFPISPLATHIEADQMI